MADRMLTDSNFDMVEKLEAFARDHGHTLLELAFGWLASQPDRRQRHRRRDEARAGEVERRSGDWRLTAEEMAEVDQLTK